MARSTHPDLPDTNHQVIVQFVAHGFAGAIKAWLSDDSVTKTDLVEAAPITLASINSTDPLHPTLHPAPYTGIQFVDIPQFESLGVQVAQQIAGAIAGTESVSQALKTSQSDASQYTPQQLSGG
jgi:hypothetical protein